MRCCLTTPDPGPWKAGVDDAADPQMIRSMHYIRDRLSYAMPMGELIQALESAIQIDNRTMLGGDIQRCLLSNAAHRLTLLTQNIDPAPWRSLRERLADCWSVLKRRGVVIHVSGSVYDRETAPKKDGDGNENR